jgi:ABC-type antimicrobial peptide transport system permease subunit
MARYYNIIVRVSDRPDAFADSVRGVGRAMNPPVSASAFLTTRSIGRAQRQAAMLATLGALGGGLALALAVFGVFSVTAFVVGQRTREIGLRMAVGASASRIVRLLLHDGLRPVVVGLVVGLIGAIAGSRVLAAAMFGLSPYDPLSLFAAAIVLLTAGVAAIVIPARRAARVDPAKTLREA